LSILCITVNFSAMLLHLNAWPFSAAPNIALPNDLICIINHFTNFYAGLHKGRKLTWLHQHSKCEVQSVFSGQVYILQVSIGTH
jgi:hypothetical protein